MLSASSSFKQKRTLWRTFNDIQTAMQRVQFMWPTPKVDIPKKRTIQLIVYGNMSIKISDAKNACD